MVDQRDDNRDDFIINEDFAAEEEAEEEIHRQQYYRNSSEILRKKSIIPYAIGGLVLAVVVILFVLFLASPEKEVDRDYLQALEARMQQLEQKQASIGVLDQALERLGQQEQALAVLDKKLNRLESTVTTQIDQIIKELGVLHQKIAQNQASVTPAPKTVEKKQPVASKKAESKIKFHEVQAGDTLYRISRRYGLSIEQLRSYNNLAPDAAIYPGQKLNLSANTKK